MLSAPPLVPASLELEPLEREGAGLEPAEVGAAAAEPEADRPVDAENGNGEAVARAIAAEKRAAVQACFERELKQTPTLRGTLVVELELAPPHQVNAVRINDDLERPAFTQCVSSTMEHLSFVALNEEISVRVPYLLSARAK